QYYSGIILESVDHAEEQAKTGLAAWASQHPNPEDEFPFEVFFSKDALNALLNEASNLPPVPLGKAGALSLKIRESRIDFGAGFPRLELDAELLRAGGNLTIAAEGVAVLEAQPFRSDVPPTLRVRLIRLVPKLRPKLFDFTARNLLRDAAQALTQM